MAKLFFLFSAAAVFLCASFFVPAANAIIPQREVELQGDNRGVDRAGSGLGAGLGEGDSTFEIGDLPQKSVILEEGGDAPMKDAKKVKPVTSIRSYESPGPGWQIKPVMMPTVGPPEWVLTRVTGWESPGDDYEREIIMMPTTGPPTWVLKGSQGMSPTGGGVNPGASPFSNPMPTGGTVAPTMPIHAPSGVTTDGAKLPLPSGATEGAAAGKSDTSSVKASFSDVSGLEVETAPIDYRTGSEETHVSKQPGLTKYSNIHMKYGATTQGLSNGGSE